MTGRKTRGRWLFVPGVGASVALQRCCRPCVPLGTHALSPPGRPIPFRGGVGVLSPGRCSDPAAWPARCELERGCGSRGGLQTSGRYSPSRLPALCGLTWLLRPSRCGRVCSQDNQTSWSAWGRGVWGRGTLSIRTGKTPGEARRAGREPGSGRDSLAGCEP